jgi:pantoate--beta-alanine ligase
VLEAAMREVLALHPGLAVEYIAVVSSENLAPVAEADAASVVVVAARAGRTRLIDNVILGEGL